MRMLSVQLVRILLRAGGNILLVIITGGFVSGLCVWLVCLACVSGLCVWVTGGPCGQGGEEAGGAGGYRLLQCRV